MRFCEHEKDLSANLLSSPSSSSRGILSFFIILNASNGIIMLSDGVQDHFSVLFDQFRDEILREYIHPLKLRHM